ncbi:MAG: acyltransferase [Phycisphaeraceae bacterium]|nr:acyltransferase [Phycisphaeraceae bacterium]
MTSQIRYRPEIDGLRCFAVLAVIIFHANTTILPGGYLGVDVFFVISGFLITSIIFREAAGGRFSFKKFWGRRIKRILPAATLVLMTVSLIQSQIIFRPDLELLLNEKIASLLSFANFHFWGNTRDYWGHAAVESPFLHYWSLAVEEQYYLFYPIFFVVIYSNKRIRENLPVLLFLFMLASFAFFAYGSVHDINTAFYLLPARAWQLGAGCLLAVSANQKPFGNAALGTITGICLIAIAYAFPTNTNGIGYQSLVVVAGASLIIGSGSNRVSSVILENAPVVFIGRISYSLYLWHWPILVTLKKLRDYGSITSNITLAAIGGGALIALSIGSYYLIENPFRRNKYGVPAALCFVVAAGFFFVVIEPNYLSRSYTTNFDKPTWHGRYYDLKPDPAMSKAYRIIAESVHTPERQASRTAYREGGIIRQRSSKYPKVVVIGDSHGVMWSKSVDSITKEMGLTTSLWSMNGVPFYTQVPPGDHPNKALTQAERMQYDAQRLSLIKKWKPDLVIIGANWKFIPGDYLTDIYDFLEIHAENVLLIESPPVLDGVGCRCVYQYLPFLGIEPPASQDQSLIWERCTFTQTQRIRAGLVQVAFERPTFSLLPTADLFASDGGAIIGSGPRIYYLDDNHLTDEGTDIVKPRIKMAIQNILGGDRNSFPIVSDSGSASDKTLRSLVLPNNKGP